MRKIINIDGKDVGFKASASIAYKYQAHFKKDLLKLIMPMIKAVMPAIDNDKADLNAVALEALGTFELTDVYNLIWVMAKADNPSIDTPEKWYDQFDQFPAMEVLKELFEILIPSMFTTEESKKKMMGQLRKTK